MEARDGPGRRQEDRQPRPREREAEHGDARQRERQREGGLGVHPPRPVVAEEGLDGQGEAEGHQDGPDEDLLRRAGGERPHEGGLEGEAEGRERQQQGQEGEGPRDRHVAEQERGQRRPQDHERAVSDVQHVSGGQGQRQREGDQRVDAAEGDPPEEQVERRLGRHSAGRSHAQVRLLHVRVGEQRPARPLLADPPGLEDVGAVGQLEGQEDLLLHEQDGQPVALEPRHGRVELVHHERRQAERGLVEHEQARPREERHRDRQHLLLAAGQGAGELAAAGGEDGEEGPGPLERPPQPLRRRHREAPQLQVLLDRHRREQAASLGDQGQPATDARVGRLVEERRRRRG